MTDIPDDVVVDASRAYLNHAGSKAEAMRAAGRVFVEWERGRDKWLPIETAPKDGTPILCCWEDQIFDAALMHCEGGMFGWLTEEMDFHCKPNMQPTHWMPIPRRASSLPAPTPDDCNPSDYT